MPNDVRQERTGWRDLNLNDRHRKWGWDCPAADIDWLFLEYDKGKATALVEYKHESAKPQYASHPTYQAMIDLGNRAGLPVFAARYASDFSWWKIVPLNLKAKEFMPERTDMNEREWVRFLYQIRGREVPDGLFENWDVEI